MKRRIWTALVVAGIALLLGSCTAVLGFIFPNEFNVAGSSYSLSKMYVLNYGQYGTSNYYLDVWLTSDGIVIDSTGQGSGEGEQIGFYLISAAPTLGEGTFTYSDNSDGPAGTMYGGVAFVGGDFAAGTADAMYFHGGGVLTVKLTMVGDDYVLDFTGTTDQGVEISAHYRGPIEAEIESPTGLPGPTF